MVDGIKQSPIEGVSMAYTFDGQNANAPSTHKTQYFEMFGDHAIYHDGWIASTKVIRPPWVPGGANQEPVINVPVGTLRPDQGLDASHERRGKQPREAQGNAGPVPGGGEEVPGAAARRLAWPRLVTPRPNITAGRTEFTWTTTADRHPATAMRPSLLNTSYTITAEIGDSAKAAPRA